LTPKGCTVQAHHNTGIFEELDCAVKKEGVLQNPLHHSNQKEHLTKFYAHGQSVNIYEHSIE